MMIRVIKRLPFNTMILLIIVYIVLALFNVILIIAGFDTGASVYFPISIFTGPTIHLSGLPYVLLFLIILYFAVKYSNRFNILQVWILGVTLIIIGNLVQGGVDDAFYKPFYMSDIQYYHEAEQITEWPEWLSNFNVNQIKFTDHARTHPPFAVLFHYFLLNIGSHKLFILAFTFTLLSSLSIFVVWEIIKLLGISSEQSSQLALLFSVIPAVNIYSAVCLDGVIGMFSTLCLLGIVITIKHGIKLSGIILFTFSILMTNLITFGGTFLFATAGLIALKEIFFHKRYGTFIMLLISLLAGIFMYVIIIHYFGYDHLESFITASKIENEGGFLALYAPVKYCMTRIEDIAEIALFLSIGILSLLFHSKYLHLNIFDIYDDSTSIFLVGVCTLIFIFLLGAFKTGETARACLFIYPFIIIVLRNLDEKTISSAILFAGLQTIIMQTFGGYFW
ncbi:hypothetical protein ACFL4V_01480 [Candidatus Latescibacterota bacterium]